MLQKKQGQAAFFGYTRESTKSCYIISIYIALAQDLQADGSRWEGI